MQQSLITTISFDLPIGIPTGGLTLEGDPARVVSASSELYDVLQQPELVVQCFVTQLEIGSDLQIEGYLGDAHKVTNLLVSNAHLNRRITVQTSVPNSFDNVCYLKHTLPAEDFSMLGLSFEGFPARIKSVNPGGFMAGKIHPGQAVEAVVVPGRDVLNLQSTGFTGSRVEQYLKETSYIQGRQLIVCDNKQLGITKDMKRSGEHAAFDLGGFSLFRRR